MFRARGEACSQASGQQPCLMYRGFDLNKPPLILRASSEEVPPSPATHCVRVFLEASEDSLPAAGTGSSRGGWQRGEQGRIVSIPQWGVGQTEGLSVSRVGGQELRTAR